jgi:hypothetical protein
VNVCTPPVYVSNCDPCAATANTRGSLVPPTVVAVTVSLPGVAFGAITKFAVSDDQLVTFTFVTEIAGSLTVTLVAPG